VRIFRGDAAAVFQVGCLVIVNLEFTNFLPTLEFNGKEVVIGIGLIFWL
jgi:hypothetical protein